MRDVKKKRRVFGKDRIIFGVFMFVILALFAGQAMAIDFDLFGSPLTFKGYINQSVQFGVTGDDWDTYKGFQQGITEALLEIEYLPTDDLKLFVSGQLFKDWSYNIYDSDDDWNRKRFNQARNEMSLRTDYEDILKECHLTWSPPGFNFRVGKQIVSWGRMDGVRIMDQINPMDRRLGPSDVEFETSIVPIWMVKAEYYPGWVPPFLDEFGIEFTFNPNADFIPNKLPSTGNKEYGIWAAGRLRHIEGVAAPLDLLRIGLQDTPFENPDDWSDGHEYAVRIKGTFPDSTYFTLNFFDGVSDDPVFMPDFTKGIQPGIDFDGIDGDGIIFQDHLVILPYMQGYYADQKYAGFTFSRDFSELYISWLGGVSPLVRCEAIYEFDTAFTRAPVNPVGMDYSFVEKDAIFWGIGIDWKFKWNLLNPRRYFSFVPQFSMRHIRDYPTGGAAGHYLMNAGGMTVSENNYSILIRMDTWYMHDKLQPMIIFQRDIHGNVERTAYPNNMRHMSGSVKADMWLFKLIYQPNHIWTFKAQLTLLENDGNDEWERGMQNKDNLSFTVQYQF